MNRPLTPAQVRKRNRPAFDLFWQAYPKKVAMQDAERAFSNLVVTEQDAKVLIQKARSYAASVEGTDPKYIPAAHSWLRAGRYDDPDLFTSEQEREREWFRQCWRDTNVKAVENRYCVKFPKQYPPDDVTSADAISLWYRETARAWISQIAQEKLRAP